jgi:hypothetical protein
MCCIMPVSMSVGHVQLYTDAFRSVPVTDQVGYLVFFLFSKATLSLTAGGATSQSLKRAASHYCTPATMQHATLKGTWCDTDQCHDSTNEPVQSLSRIDRQLVGVKYMGTLHRWMGTAETRQPRCTAQHLLQRAY